MPVAINTFVILGGLMNKDNVVATLKQNAIVRRNFTDVCIKKVNDLNYGLVDYVYLQDKKKGIGVRFPVEGVDSDISEEAFIDIVLQACISYAKSESKIRKCSDIRYAVKNHTLRIKLSYKGLEHTIDTCMIAGELLDLNVLIQSVISDNGILVPLLVTGRTLPVYGNERVYEWFANRVITHSDGFLNVIASALQQLKKKKLLCNSKWFKTLLDMRFSAQEIVWLNYKMFGKSSYGDSAKLLLVRFMQTCLEPEVDLGDDMRKLIVEALLDERGLKKVELFKDCSSVDNEANWLFIKSLVERNLLCSDCPFYLVHVHY